MRKIVLRRNLRGGISSGITLQGSGSQFLDRWNIANKENDGSHFDVVNHTNNGLERYNHHFNRLFRKKPSLLEFVQIIEKESRAQDQKLSNIKDGKRRKLEQEEQMITDIPPAYFT